MIFLRNGIISFELLIAFLELHFFLVSNSSLLFPWYVLNFHPLLVVALEIKVVKRVLLLRFPQLCRPSHNYFFSFAIAHNSSCSSNPALSSLFFSLSFFFLVILLISDVKQLCYPKYLSFSGFSIYCFNSNS